MATIMSSTPVRYPTPNASTGSPQPTSVEVTDPLLCPPELDLVTRVSHPCICLCWGGIGASAPCLAAVPVVCDTTRLQLGSTTTQAVAVPLYSHRHWYNVRRIVGGDRDLNAPCWLRRYAACFLFINSGVSHGLNGGALPNASTRRRFHPTHVC